MTDINNAGGSTRVLYPGGFDLLHGAHINALHAARKIAGKDGTLIVAVNSDEFMSYYKRKPMNSERRRVIEVESTGIADEVIIWNGPDHQDEQILAARPDFYIAGTDWLGKDLAKQLNMPTLEWFDENNISLLFMRRTPGISTTLLIEGMQ